MPLIRATLFCGLLLSLLAIKAGAEQVAITLTTAPPLTEARPGTAPVKMALEIRDSRDPFAGKAWIKIRLTAPPSPRLFSTDFPRVEGTLLFEMTLPVSNGSAEWEYVFPIRGVYRLEAELGGERGTEAKSVFELPIRENRQKLVFLGGFIAALFLFGLIAGRLFTAPR